MDNQSLHKLLMQQFTDSLEGETGHWEFMVNEVYVYCFTDEAHDRMRFIAGVANLDEIEAEQLMTCLIANFDRTLDARYCIYDNTLWSAYIHPLTDLTEDQAKSALNQVEQLVINFGSSYSSGVLVFASPEDDFDDFDNSPSDKLH